MVGALGAGEAAPCLDKGVPGIGMAVVTCVVAAAAGAHLNYPKQCD